MLNVLHPSRGAILALIAARRFDIDISPEACKLSDHHPIVLDFDLKSARSESGMS